MRELYKHCFIFRGAAIYMVNLTASTRLQIQKKSKEKGYDDIKVRWRFFHGYLEIKNKKDSDL